MKKKSEKTQVAYGRKHCWVDTQGHAHRIVFDEKTLEKPRATWLVLGVVTFFALAVGLVGVLTAPHKERESGYAAPSKNEEWKYLGSIDPDGDLPQTISAGWNDEFFVADRQGVALYNSRGEKLDYWPNELDKEPTATLFVADVNSARNGVLLIAYTSDLYALRFSLDRVASGEGAELVFTAKGGAVGTPELFLSIPETDIRGLESTPDRLFVADYAGARVLRYSWSKIEALQDAPKKELIPDCAIGEPDASIGYSGLTPSFERNFSVAYLTSSNEIFVANSGRLRIDAFNANTGALSVDHGVGKNSDVVAVFSGPENPSAIAPIGVDRIVAAEYRSPLDLADGYASGPVPIVEYNLIGQVASRIASENDARALDVPVVALDSSYDGSRLYALYADGTVDVWQRER